MNQLHIILESKHLVKYMGVAVPFYAACFASVKWNQYYLDLNRCYNKITFNGITTVVLANSNMYVFTNTFLLSNGIPIQSKSFPLHTLKRVIFLLSILSFVNKLLYILNIVTSTVTILNNVTEWLAVLVD